jgi:hypothetical protein
MLNITDGRITLASGWRLMVSGIGIAERAVVAQVGVSAPRRHPSRFSNMVRGGTVIGLLASASGGIVFQMAGWTFSPIAQTVVAVLGVLAGLVIGAREKV